MAHTENEHLAQWRAKIRAGTPYYGPGEIPEDLDLKYPLPGAFAHEDYKAPVTLLMPSNAQELGLSRSRAIHSLPRDERIALAFASCPETMDGVTLGHIAAVKGHHTGNRLLRNKYQ